MQFAQLLSDIFQITGPVFGLVLIGMWLKRREIIDDHFIKVGSGLTFKAALPVLIFLAMLNTDLSQSIRGEAVFFLVGSTLACFSLAWLWAIKFVDRENRGIFTQGAYRANSAIVGLALATNLYGDVGIALAGIMLSATMPMLIIPSAIVLATYGKNTGVGIGQLVLSIVKNPMLIGLILGAICSALGLGLPVWIEATAKTFASITLPLALVCIGGGVSLASLRRAGKVTVSASLFKTLWFPIIFTSIAVAFGFRGMELGMIFVFLACPTAVASYVMARAVGDDGVVTGNIIALSTLFSIFTIVGGLFVLQATGLL